MSISLFTTTVRRVHSTENATPAPANVVQFYSEHAGQLLKTQQQKIHKFIEHQCIEYEGDSRYICKPIANYNKTTYTMQKDELGEWHYT